MPYVCCVPGCKTSGKRIFHSFPKDENVCRKWIARTKCFFLNRTTAYKTHHKVCRNHFRGEDLRNWNLLHKGAVPSIGLPSKTDFSTEHLYNFQNPIIVGQNVVRPIINDAPDASSNDFFDASVYENIEILDENYITHQLSCESLNYLENTTDEVILIDNVEHVQDNNVKQELLSLDIEMIDLPIPCASEERSYVLKDIIVEEVSGIFHDGSVDCPAENVEIDTLNQDYPRPFLTDDPDYLDSQNVENIVPDDTQPKSTRKYDPVARKMRYQSTRIKFLTQKIKNLQNVNDSNLLTYLSTKLPPEEFQLVRQLLRNAGRAPEGRRYNFEDKTMALAIYKLGPKCYRHLRKMFGFPSKQTLNKHSANIRFQEGVSPKLMQYIKDSAAKLNKTDKKITIAWDEIALTAHLDFQETKDYIDGFQDVQATGTNSFATHALVFMIRGLTSTYKQPIAYFLTESISSGELSELIKLIIKAVLRTGMFISINITH